MNQEKINDLLHKVMDLKYDTQQVLDNISSMDSAYEEQTGREQALEREVAELKEGRDMLEKNVQYLRDESERLKRDVESNGAEARGWKDKYYAFKETLIKAEDPRVVEDKPTMPVIPKAVAISIFREGVQHGVEAACSELDNASDISIEENEYCGDFEVSFSKYIDLSDHVDTDWMRGKCGDYSEESVIDALGNLCAEKKFECRIHGVDDQEEKKND